MILSCSNINKSFGITHILKDVSFNIAENEKVAIVGVNGAGKSTMFNIITGELTRDTGDIIYSPKLQLGYMSQMLKLNSSKTIYTELLTVFDDIINMELEIEELSEKMASLTGHDLDTAMKRYSNITEEIEAKDGYSYKSKVRGVIKGLGFENNDFDTPISALSGGQKTRISMAKLLLTAPDILLLDEPTNHLDIESVSWLEDFLKNYKGTVILISHDRYFINRIVTKIVEIENGKAFIYNGNYDFYYTKKEEIREIALKHYVNQQREIKSQEESIKLLRSFNREKSVKRAESKEKSLNKMQKIDAPDNLPDKIKIDLSPKITSGEQVLSVRDVAKSFNEDILFENASFDITKGEKVALIGANGIGKTTLFKIILNSIGAESGKVKLGANVTIGYYDQEQQALNADNTIFDEISNAYPTLKNTEIRNTLAAFVFKNDDVFKTIKSLSGGERGRVALVKIMLSGANFLILDEPTNHLDIFTKNILEESLKEYDGTLIYISHDRYFINNTANKILELTKNGVKTYLGNYDYYLEKKLELETPEPQPFHVNSLNLKSLNLEQKENILSSEKQDLNNKENWRKKKEDEANIRKVKNQIKAIELKIEQTEKELENLNSELSLEHIYTDHTKAAPIFAEKEIAENLLLELYEEWEELSS